MSEEHCRLGIKYRDRVTGFAGIATALKFVLYGGTDVLIQPDRLTDDGKVPDSCWFDEGRLLDIKIPTVHRIGFTYNSEQPVVPDPDSLWTSQQPRPTTP